MTRTGNSILMLKQGQRVQIGEAWVTVLGLHEWVGGGVQVKIGIQAPVDVPVLRENAIKKEAS